MVWNVLHGIKQSARPTDSAIESALHDFVLSPFSQYASYSDLFLPVRREESLRDA